MTSSVWRCVPAHLATQKIEQEAEHDQSSRFNRHKRAPLPSPNAAAPSRAGLPATNRVPFLWEGVPRITTNPGLQRCLTAFRLAESRHDRAMVPRPGVATLLKASTVARAFHSLVAVALPSCSVLPVKASRVVGGTFVNKAYDDGKLVSSRFLTP